MGRHGRCSCDCGAAKLSHSALCCAFPAAAGDVSSSSSSSPALGTVSLFTFVILWCVEASHCGFNLCFPDV